MARLNQWTQQRKPTTGLAALTPFVETLPQELHELPAVPRIRKTCGSRRSTVSEDLQQTVWLSAVAERARGQESEPLPIAQALFDWVVRNEQIERDANV